MNHDPNEIHARSEASGSRGLLRRASWGLLLLGGLVASALGLNQLAPPVATPDTRVLPTAPRAAHALTPRLLRVLPWGAGEGEVGHLPSQESAAFAPNTAVTDTSGTLHVLDIVNQRILRVGPNGEKLGATPLPTKSAIDLLLAPRGGYLVLDSLIAGEVSLLELDGRVARAFPVASAAHREASLATGLFVHLDDVYVEHEHTRLERVGGLRQDHGPGGVDGRFVAVDATVSVELERPSTISLERHTLGAPGAALAKVVLDDRVESIVGFEAGPAGTMLLAAHTTSPPRPGTTEIVDDAYVLIVLDAAGHERARTTIPLNPRAEEIFRPVRVGADGQAVVLVAGEDGLAVHAVDLR